MQLELRKEERHQATVGTGLVIERRFTTVGEDPFDQFDWIEMDVEIRNADGSLAHRIDDVRLPSGYSGVPGKVLAQKYLRKAGVPAILRKVAEEGVRSGFSEVSQTEKLQTPRTKPKIHRRKPWERTIQKAGWDMDLLGLETWLL